MVQEVVAPIRIAAVVGGDQQGDVGYRIGIVLEDVVPSRVVGIAGEKDVTDSAAVEHNVGRVVELLFLVRFADECSIGCEDVEPVAAWAAVVDLIGVLEPGSGFGPDEGDAGFLAGDD